MPHTADIIAAKYRELVERIVNQVDPSHFTRAERAIYFIANIAAEIDINGFSAVFDQALSRSELIETIGYLKALGQPKIADLLEQALTLLDQNKFYGPDDRPISGSWDLPEQIRDKLDVLEEKYRNGEGLWSNLDENLYEMLLEEKNSYC